ncbi:JmjC domain, hydroxylase-domain-containing protein, partial [Hyaloscypha sp. PMI_1271]
MNVLLAGMPKVWKSVVAHHARKFEDVIAEDFKIKAEDRVCDNWIRELRLYVRETVLKKHKIHYCSFTQMVNQVVILVPHTYHWGHNTGPNEAEAVNFGDKYWSPIGAKFCADMSCRHKGTIQETHWEWRREGELQMSVGIREFAEAEEDVLLKSRVVKRTLAEGLSHSKALKRSSADHASSRTRAAYLLHPPKPLQQSQKEVVSEYPVNRLRSQRAANLRRSSATSDPHSVCATSSREMVPGCAESALIDHARC